MSELVIREPETADLIAARGPIEERANSITISSHSDLEDAADFLCQVKTARKLIEDRFAPIKAAAHKAHREITGLERQFLAPLAVSEQTVKMKVTIWNTEQERLRREEEARLREIARKEEEERRLAEAAKLEADGETEAAEQVLSEPITPVIAPILAPPKVEGIRFRKTWKARVVNELAIPRQFLIPDQKKLDNYARSMCEQASVPGVEFYAEKIVAAILLKG